MRINVPRTELPRIVIVGGGFGGLELAKSLKHTEAQVVLIDQNNYHTFQPLLYQVATAGLEPDSIAFPIRKIFRNQKNFVFRMAAAKEISAERNTLITSIGEITYDYLVLSTGSDTNFFGNQNVETFGMPMKNIVEALDLRSVILQNLEQALLMEDAEERNRLMNIVIVGGGPTGVETAGALGELKNHILAKDYPELPIEKMQIILVEACNKLLVTFSEKSSTKTAEFLKDLGVNVYFNTMVQDYDGYTIKTNGQDIPSRTLIWAAGVAGAPVAGLKAEAVVRGKRYLVDKFNKLTGYNNIYAIGDVAAMFTEETPIGHPMVAPVAIQQAKNLGKNFKQLFNNKPLAEFKYFDKGSMATIGRNKAVVEIKNFRTHGLLAWFMWTFVHLMMLVGFRNKIIVLVNWFWNYIIYERGIRLIIRPFKRSGQEEYKLKKAV